MAYRFNPPPNWPALPAGWEPPPGWQPPPDWPPIPHGWPLWTNGEPSRGSHRGAWITAGATVLAAVLGLIGIMVSNARPDPAPQARASAQPSSSLSSSAETSSPSPSSPSASTAAKAGAERWSGLVTPKDESLGIDLDMDPPRRAVDDEAGDIRAGGLSAVGDVDGPVTDYDASSSIGEWTLGGTPTFEQCRETALSQGSTEVRTVRKGTLLCVLTSEDRIARLKVTKVLKYEGFLMSATVWDQ